MSVYEKIIESPLYVVSLAVLSVFIVGIADYLTNIDINLAIFYLFPISFVTWFAGRNEGIFISALAVIVWFTTDFVLIDRSYAFAAIPYWNAAMRFGVFVFVVLLLSRLKVALLHEKETSRLKSNMLSLVSHLNIAMTSTLDLHTVGRSLLETAELLFPGCVTTIRLLNRETGNLEPLASYNLDEKEWTTALPVSPLAQEVLEAMAPLIVGNIQTDPRTQSIEFFRRNGLVSFLGLRLSAGGDTLGILCIYTKKEHRFTQEEVTFFNTLASQAAIALQNARLFEEVRNGHTQLRDLSRRLLDVQESDRRHVARELHDEIGQILTGLQLTLQMIGRLSFQEASIRLDKAQSLVNELIGRVRGLSLDLRPSMLDDLGLLPALIWHIERYSSSTGVEVKFNHNGLEGKRFTSQLETSAYRIVQEALTNIARHTGVKRAMVHAWCMPDTLILEIQDEGSGFDAETAIRTGKANGLTGMRERTMLLGGESTIESTPGAGTCVIAELPLGEPRNNGQDNYRISR
jgi:signal transduction histidine kinase